MNTLEILTRARALIADEKNWTPYCLALCAPRYQHGRRINQTVVRYDSPLAFSFCARGAIKRIILDPENSQREIETCIALARTIDSRVSNYIDAVNIVIKINDNLGHKEVLKMFDRAITAEKIKADALEGEWVDWPTETEEMVDA